VALAPVLPPADLANRKPDLLRLRRGTLVHRFFEQRYDTLFFDRSAAGRFNAPDGSYGVLYVARTASGAFAETFLRQPGRTVLPADLLARKAYVCLRLERPLKLVRLTGPGLALLGATAEVPHAGLPYSAPQAWSKALKDHPARVDGIAYTARHNDQELCYALFEGALLTEARRVTELDDDWFWRLADSYGVGLLP
jgi:hypothetical protein